VRSGVVDHDEVATPLFGWGCCVVRFIRTRFR
jgi:hypothetical protein